MYMYMCIAEKQYKDDARIFNKYNELMSFRHEKVIIYNLKQYFSFFALCHFFRSQFSRSQKGRDTSAISNNCFAMTICINHMVDTQSSQSNYWGYVFMLYSLGNGHSLRKVYVLQNCIISFISLLETLQVLSVLVIHQGKGFYQTKGQRCEV